MKRAAVLAVLVAFFIFPSPLFAQENDGTVIISPTPTPITYVEYEMPYPGLLPDNPFYIMKTTRDQLIGLLITDEAKKAEFALLQADKRFQAGYMLFQKDEKKKDLAFTTISKSHNYLHNAITSTEKSHKDKTAVTDTDQRIIKSIRKQQELLRNVQKTKRSAKQEVTVALEKLDELLKTAEVSFSRD